MYDELVKKIIIIFITLFFLPIKSYAEVIELNNCFWKKYKNWENFNSIIFQYKKGQLPNGAFEDNIISIDLNTSIVTHLRIHTDAYIAKEINGIKKWNESQTLKYGSAAILNKNIPQKYESFKYGIVGIVGNVIEIQRIKNNSLSGYSEFIDLTKNELDQQARLRRTLKCNSNFANYGTNANEESVIKNLLKKLY